MSFRGRPESVLRIVKCFQPRCVYLVVPYGTPRDWMRGFRDLDYSLLCLDRDGSLAPNWNHVHRVLETGNIVIWSRPHDVDLLTRLPRAAVVCWCYPNRQTAYHDDLLASPDSRDELPEDLRSLSSTQLTRSLHEQQRSLLTTWTEAAAAAGTGLLVVLV